MAHILLLDTIKEDMFVCGDCKLIFNSLNLFLDHKSFQCLRKQIKDPVVSHHTTISAPKSFNSELYLAKKQVREKAVFGSETGANISCSVCRKSFKRLKYLYDHLKCHEQPCQCHICGRCFENNSHLKRHINSHKVWPDGLNGTTPKSSEVELLSYSCSYCAAVLSNYSQFRAHLNNHLSLKTFKCIQGECNMFFKTINLLLDHVSTYHNSPKYICHLCKTQFSSLEDIALHHQNHSQPDFESKVKQNVYKCSKCDAAFRKSEKLSLHLFTETHNKPCIHCNKTFASDKRLRMHLQIHKKAKPYQCSICSSSFHMKKYLNSHILKHGESQFTCTDCKQKFKRQDVLQRHMKTHLLKNKFQCPFRDATDCKKEFTRRDKLNEHIKTHCNQFKCSNTENSTSTPIGTLEMSTIPLASSDISK